MAEREEAGATAEGRQVTDRAAVEVELVAMTPDQTRGVGVSLGRRLRTGDVVLLHGDLGAGKTTLAQGIALGLGVADAVQSPTFALVHEYEGRDAAGTPTRLYHLDLYRLGGAADLDSFGFDEYLAAGDGVSLIEWPERAGSRLDGEMLVVRLTPSDGDRRRITLTSTVEGMRSSRWLGELETELAGVIGKSGLGEADTVGEGP